MVILMQDNDELKMLLKSDMSPDFVNNFGISNLKHSAAQSYATF